MYERRRSVNFMEIRMFEYFKGIEIALGGVGSKGAISMQDKNEELMSVKE